jgi:hypothetical protein
VTDWPDELTVAPIREWPGTLRAPVNREVARFKRPGYRNDDTGKWVGPTPVLLSTTLADLNRELRALRATDGELLVAIDPAQFRVDGRPYANAKAAHPGVILSFEIPKVGRVSYPCDKYTRWEDNLRAITLALEALRLIDRHGVTRRGEQYRGFLAIEAATAAPAGFSDRQDALLFLAGVTGRPYMDYPARELVRLAQRKTHPDRGGDAAKFQRVSLAEALLRREGLL